MSWLQEAIHTALQNNQGLAVGKLGTVEAECLFIALHGHPWNGLIRQQMTRNAGLWSASEKSQGWATNATVASWASYMRREVLPHMDHIVEWFDARHERPVLEAWAPHASRHKGLESLDPWVHPWTAAIPSGTPVAIVTAFAASVDAQIPNIASLPSSTLEQPLWASPPPAFFTVRTGCSPALDAEGPAAWSAAQLAAGWKAAVEECVGAVVAGGARIALVGCGALSLPVVVALKKRGIIAIHLGGALQVLFGIRGRRWRRDPVIGPWLLEPTWQDPLPAEIPRNANLVEGGCYWN